MSLSSINMLALGVVSINMPSVGIGSSGVMSSMLLASTALCIALILWFSWRHKAGNWILLLGICTALLAVLWLPVSKKNAQHIYVLTKEQPPLHESFVSTNGTKSVDNVLLSIASVPVDASLLSVKDNKDVVVIDLSNKSAADKMLALRPYQNARAWTIMGNDFPAKDALAFSPPYSALSATEPMRTLGSAPDEQAHLPAIHWQSAHKYSESLEYSPVVPVHGLWTLNWKMQSHQAEVSASLDSAKWELQLIDSNEQLLSRGIPMTDGVAQLSHRFAAQGRYNFQLRFLHDGQEMERQPVSVYVSEAREIDARLYFASPSFEWRALKRWLEQSKIPYQSQVKTAKDFNRRDQFGARVDDSTPLLLFDERSWLAQSKAEVQARTQQVHNGAIIIVVTEASDTELNELQTSSYSPMQGTEFWRKQELRLFGALTEHLSFTSTSRSWRIDSAKLGQGGVILIREKEWHRVESSAPEQYSQVMAEAIGSLWRTSSLSWSNESELLAPGKLSRLCVDNAFPADLRIEQRQTGEQRLAHEKDEISLELVASARAGQYCANRVFDRSGWYAVYINYALDANSNSGSGTGPEKSTEQIKLGEIFIPDKSSPNWEASRHHATLTFHESDSERTKPSRLEQSKPAWRAWAFLGLVVLLSALWWHDQKKSVSGEYRKAD